MQSYRDRRASRRITYRASVRELGAFAGEARTINLSKGGLYLQRLSGKRLRRGDMVDLMVDLPGRSVRARGCVVCEVDEVFFPGAAVAFIDMEPDDREHLADFVDGRRMPPRGAVLARINVESRVA